MTLAITTTGHDRQFFADLPGWVPDHTWHYLAHTGAGVPIRALARGAGVHASTVLRQVRRTEQRRDDPLIDTVLRNLEARLNTKADGSFSQEIGAMTVPKTPSQTPEDIELLREGARVLRRLCETGAVLAVASEMEKAVVVRDGVGGAGSTRTAVTGSDVAAMLLLKDWIATEDTGRIRRYAITSMGKTALRDVLKDMPDLPGNGFAEDQSGFTGAPADPLAGEVRRRMRYGLAESPLIALARRRDKSGVPFLADDLVNAGERLREDFELSQMEPNTAQNWDSFLTAGVTGKSSGSGFAGQGVSAARQRVAAALSDLGPGLADVVLRCCCYLEGLENAEKKLGWSARSGKIVLRIALMQLKRHYQETAGKGGAMIG